MVAQLCQQPWVEGGGKIDRYLHLHEVQHKYGSFAVTSYTIALASFPSSCAWMGMRLVLVSSYSSHGIMVVPLCM